MHILVTGGFGFIGSSFVRKAILKGHSISIVDKMSYAADLDNIPADIVKKCNFEVLDIGQYEQLDRYLKSIPTVDRIVNFAAESHVDRSISNGTLFVESNILGVVNLLEHVKQNRNIEFLQVSTDEVYGSINTGKWSEESPIDPKSPYSASKAAAELFCAAYKNTHQLLITITRCANNFGPCQSAEKFVPTVIRSIMLDKKIPLYGDGTNVREWIYVDDHAQAILNIIEKVKPNYSVYNIGGQELTNLDLVKTMLRILGKDESQISFVTDRPGHDFRYSVSSSRYDNEFGVIEHKFEENLKSTIDWYLSNPDWLERSSNKAKA
jgi:dTDP-glucose 4,6-dehydratase